MIETNKIFNDWRDKGAFFFQTLLRQEEDRWKRGHRSTMESLLAKKVGYFAYVKSYLGNDGIDYALVAGKTGSNAVIGRSDICFGIYPQPGPAKKYLFDNHLRWNQEKILIIPANSEEEAFEIEAKLQKDYRLLGS